MPYRKEQFENGEVYHITLRRLSDDLLFQDINDYYRGIFSIYEFNDDKPVCIREKRKQRERFKLAQKQIQAIQDPHLDSIQVRVLDAVDQRDKLVECWAFCLMPNHLHLLLKQLKDGGISKFMNKFGSGYARYFKDKYAIKRKGYFFDGRFFSVRVQTDDQLQIVFVYIHTNPIALIDPGWKEKGIANSEKAIEFLENYKWSSYQDYLGKKNFPSVTERTFLSEIMNSKEGCKDFVENWIKYKGEIREFVDLSLE